MQSFWDLAVGQREESQAGWLTARLVRMLCRPSSTWGLVMMVVVWGFIGFNIGYCAAPGVARERQMLKARDRVSEPE